MRDERGGETEVEHGADARRGGRGCRRASRAGQRGPAAAPVRAEPGREVGERPGGGARPAPAEPLAAARRAARRRAREHAPRRQVHPLLGGRPQGARAARHALPPLLQELTMSIDWNAFTPWRALAGGAMIGAATALFFVLNGRIAGISGIIGGLLRPQTGDVSWRLAFVLGMLAAPLAYAAFAALPEVRIDGGYSTLALAGLLVGLGTRYGSGCTSGH